MTEKAGLEIFVHPLVVVNISDHHTREKCVRKGSRVFGVLLGQQEGRRVEISNSFEMLMGQDGTIDPDFLKERQDQCM
jgi:COP9 signalosome complex subunit 6